jgi:hypothetical protein
MKQLFLMLALALFSGACCLEEEDLTDCLEVHFNDGLFEEGIEDSSTNMVDYRIEDDCLVLDLTYTGGCEEHDIKLAARGWQKTDPPTVEAKIVHDNTDPCDAILSETLSFDLSELQYADHSRLVIKLKGYDGIIEHNFTD